MEKTTHGTLGVQEILGIGRLVNCEVVSRTSEEDELKMKFETIHSIWIACMRKKQN
jgi:hypothetical protein